jgi:hypothetical protein
MWSGTVVDGALVGGAAVGVGCLEGGERSRNFSRTALDEPALGFR